MDIEGRLLQALHDAGTIADSVSLHRAWGNLKL